MEIDVVLDLLAAGWSALPVRNKLPLVQWTDLQYRRADEAEARSWCERFPDAGYGVALGRVSGVVRVDVDGPAPMPGPMPETAEFTTPSGGRGYLLRWAAWIETAVVYQGEGGHCEVRVQSDGAYTVVPPTPGYQWVRREPVADAPQWLLDWYAERMLRQQPPSTVRCDLTDEQLAETLDHVDPDSYDVWVRVGMALRSRPNGLDAWERWSRRSPKFKEGECCRKWATFREDGGLTVASVVWLARAAGWRPAWSIHEPLTEGGNAAVLQRRVQGRAWWSPALGWLAWEGCRWTVGKAAECIVQEAQKACMSERRQAAVAALNAAMAGPDLALRTRRLKAVNKVDALDREASYKGSRDLAKSSMVRDWRDFDNRPLLLNTANGTVCLQDGQLKPHDPADLLTGVVPHEYRQGLRPAAWEAFLARSLPDEQVRGYLRLKLGSTLLGETRKELLILWGPNGDNGKTLIVETMLHVLGPDYAVKCASDLLLHRRFGGGGEDDRNTLLLRGKRFASASETDEGARLNEALLKQLTGGDGITTRALYHEKFTFQPTHDLVYVTNHKPTVRGTDDALWGRIKAIEFTRSFPPGHPDRVEGLGSLLRAEAPAILSWLVEACREYVRTARRLEDPPAAKETVATYRREHDPVARFLAERFELDEGSTVLKSVVAQSYREWCAENGVREQFNGVRFGLAVKKLGVTSNENYYRLRHRTT